MKNSVHRVVLFTCCFFAFISCKTEDEKLAPLITTASISTITDVYCVCGGDAYFDNGTLITERGCCWSEKQNPTIADSKTINGQAEGAFVSYLTDLKPNTTYYVRAFATNKGGTAYGEQEHFTTKSSTISTTIVTNIGSTTAKSGGTILSISGVDYVARGVVWSTSHNPTLKDSHTNDGIDSGDFNSYLSNLSPATTYYVRAFATYFGSVTTYGNEVTFTTEDGKIKVSTTPAPRVFAVSALVEASIVSNGGDSIIEKGICWSKLANPTINDSKTICGKWSGSYAGYLLDLSPSTTYHVRSYALNSLGIAYGEDVTFTTKDSTNTVKDIDGNVYDIITINGQTWMLQNLRVTKYNNGDQIETGSCFSYKNENKNVSKYGLLYDWSVATNTKNVAPIGWHVASQADWYILFSYARYYTSYSGSLANALLTNTDNYSNYDYPGSEVSILKRNSSGFTAMLGGYRYQSYLFFNQNLSGRWWPSDKTNATFPACFNENFDLVDFYKDSGCSIRCVKDN